jgi:hypothetical protein
MFEQFGQGFARAITAGKNFGQELMNTLHQVEQEILGKLIGTVLNQLRDALGKIIVQAAAAHAAAGGIGGALGKVVGGLAGGGPQAAQQQANTTALTANTTAVHANSTVTATNTTVTGTNTGATATNTGAVGTLSGTVGTLDVSIVTLDADIIALISAILDNTIALYTTGFIPLQEGGVVSGPAGSGALAKIHAGEAVANSQMMRDIGMGMTQANRPLPQSGAQLQSIGQQLSQQSMAGGDEFHVHMDGATFNGSLGQDHVNQIMNQAVRTLRMTSRSWAFSPTRGGSGSS